VPYLRDDEKLMGDIHVGRKCSGTENCRENAPPQDPGLEVSGTRLFRNEAGTELRPEVEGNSPWADRRDGLILPESFPRQLVAKLARQLPPNVVSVQ